MTVLDKPKIDEKGIVEFDYLIFEKYKHLSISTYDTNTFMLNTDYLESGDFGALMNAIMIMIECYSNGSCYYMHGDKAVTIKCYLVLVNSLLNKRVKANQRMATWNIVRLLRKYPQYSLPEAVELFDVIPWDFVDSDIQSLSLLFMIEKHVIPQPEKIVTKRAEIKDAYYLSNLDYLKKTMTIEYKKDRAALFQYLKTLLDLPLDKRKELAERDDNYGIIAEISLYTIEPYFVFVFSILDDKDFWETWDVFNIERYEEIIRKMKMKTIQGKV